jgi:hypothetical protein
MEAAKIVRPVSTEAQIVMEVQNPIDILVSHVILESQGNDHSYR